MSTGNKLLPVTPEVKHLSDGSFVLKGKWKPMVDFGLAECMSMVDDLLPDADVSGEGDKHSVKSSLLQKEWKSMGVKGFTV